MNSSAALEGGAGDFKSRKTGLMIFGVMPILLGGMCALFVPLMLRGQTLAEQAGSSQNTQTILPSILVYAILAIALVGRGVGSIMVRRWARTLLLIFSCLWLITGAITVIVTAFLMAQFMAGTASPTDGEELPSWAGSLMVALPLIFLGVIYVIMPLG